MLLALAASPTASARVTSLTFAIGSSNPLEMTPTGSAKKPDC